MNLNDQQSLRYSRHLLLDDIGEQGQLKLQQASVLIVGMGGLGSPASLYLAAAGLGQLVLADFDTVDTSNLQRQILYKESDVDQPKVLAAKAQLQALNGELKLRCIHRKLDEKLLSLEVSQADIVLDCSDNIATRYAVNAACQQAKVPLVSGAAIGFDGQLMVFDFRQPSSPCYRCLFPDASEQQLSCSNSGVLGPVVGTIGSLQALECIKLLVDFPSPQAGRFSNFDGRSLEWFHLAVQPSESCPQCAQEQCDD